MSRAVRGALRRTPAAAGARGLDLAPALARERAQIEQRLARQLRCGASAAPRLDAAVSYSLLGGGKRLRPVLCLWAYDARRARRSAAVWRCAMALEMLHTYSLIHDDLPAMDDDDLRRGQPSCHRRFDEATAILAGDALQTEAFALLAGIRPAALSAIAVGLLADAAGRNGMAAGQQLDLHAGADGGRRGVVTLHRLKTGRLMGAALAMGAACAGVGGRRLWRVRNAGEQLGVAFQMVDDWLDASSCGAVLGKTAGKDRRQGKLTAVTALGAPAARAGAQRRARQGLAALRQSLVGGHRLPARLAELALHLAQRDR
jgi:geranylgeranyl pyrophosphate synthase